VHFKICNCFTKLKEIIYRGKKDFTDTWKGIAFLQQTAYVQVNEVKLKKKPLKMSLKVMMKVSEVSFF